MGFLLKDNPNQCSTMTESDPVSCCSVSEEQRESCPCKSLSKGMDMGLWIRGDRGWNRGSVVVRCPDVLCSPPDAAAPVPFFCSEMEATDSDRGILVFLRPLAGALAVRRRRCSLMERLRRPPVFVSTEDLEERLNSPRMPRS